MSSLLNYKIEGQGPNIVLIHGLFGSLGNLGLLARDLKQDHQVVSLDLRNHGKSFHSQDHSYELMAQDVADLIQHLELDAVTVIGHSMGGKVAMKLADKMSDQIKQLIVLDMSPVAYNQDRHADVFAGLNAVEQQKPSSRQQAMTMLAEHIKLEGVRQFLSKSLQKNDDGFGWQFNVAALHQNYHNIMGWQPIEPTHIPTLLIKGGDSDYLLPEHQPQVQQQFKNARAHVIANTGHWLHAEKPDDVLRIIRKHMK